MAVLKNKHHQQNQLPCLPSPILPSLTQNSTNTEIHRDNNDNQRKSQTEQDDKKRNGLTNEQLQKLVLMLQELHASGK